jgi:hypothetical protein
MKNLPRENGICNYFSRLRADELDFGTWERKEMFVFQSVQTNSVAYPTNCSISNGPSSIGVKQPGREADHSP